MAVENFLFTSKEQAEEKVRNVSAVVYQPVTLKWYDKLTSPPYSYFLLGGLLFWMIFQLYLKKMK